MHTFQVSKLCQIINMKFIFIIWAFLSENQVEKYEIC